MRVTIKDVAKALKVDPQTVRVMLQLNILPFGAAYRKPNNHTYSYIIYPEKFYEYVGGATK